MSNRAAIVSIMIDLDAIQDALRPIQRSTGSFSALARIRRARLAISLAKIELAHALHYAVDPVIEITLVEPAPTDLTGTAVTSVLTDGLSS
ncbi:hypothetical protein [Sphingomonas echinoides]|uniref:Uncharacterized protein n=1 Tax=Sphingomonas echinoides TaxID=59803 RepID=A0ABU4PNG8_9SPHN|nr:hypothetical protein [Sphingomonas echinoides]MDX5984672.1 hypothetical protein [Sphingomonas echinoides]